MKENPYKSPETAPSSMDTPENRQSLFRTFSVVMIFAGVLLITAGVILSATRLIGCGLFLLFPGLWLARRAKSSSDRIPLFRLSLWFWFLMGGAAGFLLAIYVLLTSDQPLQRP